MKAKSKKTTKVYTIVRGTPKSGEHHNGTLFMMHSTHPFFEPAGEWYERVTTGKKFISSVEDRAAIANDLGTIHRPIFMFFGDNGKVYAVFADYSAKEVE